MEKGYSELIQYFKNVIPERFKYDDPNNTEVLISIINLAVKYITEHHKELVSLIDPKFIDDSLKNAKKLINQIQTGEINNQVIPVRFVIEKLLNYLNNIEKTERPLDDHVIIAVLGTLETYYDYCEQFPKKYIDQMIELWERKDVRVALHGTYLTMDEPDFDESIKKYFHEGLRTSQQQIGSLALKNTAVYQGQDTFSLFDAIPYWYGYGGVTILLAIPESCFNPDNPTPLWGSDTYEIDGQEFVLPEFLVGYIPFGFEDKKIVPVNVPKKKYPCKFTDGTEKKKSRYGF